TGRHWSIILPPTMDQDSIHPAARLQIGLPGGFAMDDRQVVRKPCDWSYGHTVCDENNGHATLSGRQVESDAMRVAVVLRHREAGAAIPEDAEIPRIEGNELNNAEHLEERVPPIEQARHPENAS